MCFCGYIYVPKFSNINRFWNGKEKEKIYLNSNEDTLERTRRNLDTWLKGIKEKRWVKVRHGYIIFN
jgi:hypothetical protein